MEKGYLCPVLHAHLPFVRHPEEEDFLEEYWFFEAVSETYIPLIQIMDDLIRQGADFRLTMSLTPPLITMLGDPLLQSRYLKRLNKLLDLTEKELVRTRAQPEFFHLARMYREDFLKKREVFQGLGGNLLSAFKKFQELGKLEILASCATHGFLPLLNVNPSAVKAQIEVGIDCYEKVFGTRPRGFWLPECGYYPGLDEILKNSGVKYFLLESHGILNASPFPEYGIYAPVFCESGVAAFGRDDTASKQVWDAFTGYPGDFDYREFYRDIAYEQDYQYIKPYISGEVRVDSGIKYYRITGKNGDKQPYNPERAREKVAVHAGNFMFSREKQVESLSGAMDRKPVIIAAYDAELFGHWWFEGPLWLEFLMKKIYYDQQTIKLVTPSEYLTEYPTGQVCAPSASSWGEKGYNNVWLNGSNDWIYPHLHTSARRMEEMAGGFPHAEGVVRRALNQAARELLLAQSSDWAFIMHNGTQVEYAVRRLKEHVGRFNKLYQDIKQGKIDEPWLYWIEQKNTIFPHIDYRVYG